MGQKSFRELGLCSGNMHRQTHTRTYTHIHTYTHTHTWPSALPGPLKWSVIITTGRGREAITRLSLVIWALFGPGRCSGSTVQKCPVWQSNSEGRICDPACNFKIAVIRCDLLASTFDHLTSNGYHRFLLREISIYSPSPKFVWLPVSVFNAFAGY